MDRVQRDPVIRAVVLNQHLHLVQVINTSSFICFFRFLFFSFFASNKINMISCLLKIEALYPAAVNDILQKAVILRDQNNCFRRGKKVTTSICKSYNNFRLDGQRTAVTEDAVRNKV